MKMGGLVFCSKKIRLFVGCMTLSEKEMLDLLRCRRYRRNCSGAVAITALGGLSGMLLPTCWLRAVCAPRRIEWDNEGPHRLSHCGHRECLRQPWVSVLHALSSCWLPFLPFVNVCLSPSCRNVNFWRRAESKLSPRLPVCGDISQFNNEKNP